MFCTPVSKVALRTGSVFKLCYMAIVVTISEQSLDYIFLGRLLQQWLFCALASQYFLRFLSIFLSVHVDILQSPIKHIKYSRQKSFINNITVC